MSIDARGGWLAAGAGFAAARASGAPVASHSYTFAGLYARLTILGAALAAAFPAPWAHLECETDERETTDLEIDVWDAVEAAVQPPDNAPPIDPAARFPYAVSDDGRFVALRQPETFAWL